ncbi:MAG: hypothetical protein JJT94_09720 [Bernardetiaceae bacterium]|nr:hypothetical protein [Bernardetiaceae bacterium]
MIKYLLLFGIMLAFSACKSQKDVATNDSQAWSIKLIQQGCKGICPVYTIDIASNGALNYEGKKHLQKIEKSTHQLPDSEIEMLAKALEQSNFMQLEDRYASPATDMPSAILYLQHGNDNKKIVMRHQTPEALANIMDFIQKWVDTYNQG